MRATFRPGGYVISGAPARGRRKFRARFDGGHKDWRRGLDRFDSATAGAEIRMANGWALMGKFDRDVSPPVLRPYRGRCRAVSSSEWTNLRSSPGRAHARRSRSDRSNRRKAETSSGPRGNPLIAPTARYSRIRSTAFSRPSTAGGLANGYSPSSDSKITHPLVRRHTRTQPQVSTEIDPPVNAKQNAPAWAQPRGAGPGSSMTPLRPSRAAPR